MATVNISYGSVINLTTTNLQNLNNSDTAGWQSDLTDNTTTKALDYKIFVKCPTTNTAGANDKAAYIFISPAYNNGTSWFYADGGRAVAAVGTEGTYTFVAGGTANDLSLLGILNYATTASTMQNSFFLSNAFGSNIPQGFSILIKNFTGASFASGCTVSLLPITETVV